MVANRPSMIPHGFSANPSTSPMSRRAFLKAATVFAGTIVSGCAPRSGVPGARVTLTQWYHQYGETGCKEAVLRYAQEYTKVRPDVAVQVVWVPGDYHTKLATALLTSGGPDVFETSLTAPMVQAEQVVPLDDLFSPSVLSDFSPKDLAANSLNGKIYGIKMLDDTGVLYYRKSLLKAAGIEPPNTLDALMDAVKKLSVGNRKGLFVGNDGGISALDNLMPWSAGSDFLVDGKIVFHNPRTVAAYEKLRDLNETNGLLIGAPTDWWDPAALVQGLAAMQWTGLWAFPAIHKALGDDLGGIPWPAFDVGGTPVTFLGGWSAMVNAQGRNIEEAKKYVKWLWIDNTSDQRDWCLGYGFHVPSRMSVAQNASALHAPVPAAATKNLAAYGRQLPPTWNSAMDTAITSAVTHIVKEGASADQEVATAAAKCERELERQME